MKDLLKRGISWFRSQYAISKLRVKDGDILIVKNRDGLNADMTKFEIIKVLEKRNIKEALFIRGDNGCDLQSLSEEDMNRAGWFKKTGNPGRDEMLLNAYREKRKHDGMRGRVWDIETYNGAEECISRLERAIELEAYRKSK